MTSSDDLSARGDVLIVDDSPANLLVLTELLKTAGHRVRPVPSAEFALRAVEHQLPELILLDVNMPGMNGYQLCRQLKLDPRMAEVPVLFISGLTAMQDRMEGFRAGCVDFVSKPFELEEVRARVETHLRLRRMHVELEQRNAKLEEARAHLVELQALRDGLIHMIVHDMRAPLTGIVNSLRFLREDNEQVLAAVSLGDLDVAIRSSRRLMSMINDLLDIHRMESEQMPVMWTSCGIDTLVGTALDLLGPAARQVSITVGGADGTLDCDESLIQRVVLNLLDNALKHSSPGAQVLLSGERELDVYRFSVTDSGPGIPADYQQKIFEKFGQIEARIQRGLPSTGLGLAFCKLAIEVHGGEIGVTSDDGLGSTFWFTLPIRHSQRTAGRS